MKPRRAYTLVEMLIVIILLAILFGLAWPTLRSPWGQSKLEDAAEKVRAAMAHARREAITSVGPWQFCYRPGTADYVVGPLHLGEEKTDVTSSEESDPDDESDSLDLDSEDNEPELIVAQLPHGVTFCDPAVDLETMADSEENTTSAPVDTAMATEDLASELSSGEWSAPIVFFPNGRSTSDRLRLRSAGADLRVLSIRIRGILGAADVGKPRRIRSASETVDTEMPSSTEDVSP